MLSERSALSDIDSRVTVGLPVLKASGSAEQRAVWQKDSRYRTFVLIGCWSLIVTVLVWRAYGVHRLGLSLFIGLQFVGFLVYSLFEYLFHRFVFHFQWKNRGRTEAEYLDKSHHNSPNSPTQLPKFPGYLALFGVIFFAVFRPVLGAAWAESFSAAFLIGYISYEAVHYFCHNHVPRSRVGKYLKKNHMIHHYVDPQARFGITTPLWDIIFGTYRTVPKRAI